MKNLKNIRLIGTTASILLAAQLVADAAFVELKNGRTMNGTSVRARSNGDVILTTANGDVTYTKDQYVRAVADKPDTWDQAVASVVSNPSAAIPVLQDIVREYQNLDWDVRAMAALGEAQLNAKQIDDALDTYEKLFRQSEQAAKSNIRWKYYQGLLESKKYDKLDLALKKEVTDGAPEDTAKAQVMRGDILLAQGDIEGAMMDYLKTVLLFKQQEDVQPEALYKAGITLKQLKDERAGAQFQTVIQKYPSSEWAAKARQAL